MGTALRWWEMRGMPRATARAATLALLAAIALLHLWVVLFWRRAAAPRGAVLDAEARAGVGLSTRRDAGYDASPNVRGFVDANALVINPETYVRDRHERNVGRRLTQVPAEERREVDDYHYVFSADCKPYMDWQSVALYRSWQNVGSPGVMTRLLSCDERTLASYEYLDLMPTHVTPRYDDIDPGDDYAAYNLPGSMLHFVEHAQDALATKWIVKLDADMILRKPLTVTQGGLTAGPGVVAAGFYGYLAGVDNEMAGMFVDDAETRSRLAKVGGWEIFHAPDLARAAPLWFEYTKRVRTDKRVWWPFKGTGDVFITEANPRPWISEMYGYVFGAAVAGLRHNVVHSCQLYAGMAPWDDDSFDPFLIHYGIRIEIPDPSGSASERSDEKSLWAWDKHGELQGGPDARDKLSCAIPFAPFPEVPERLVPTPATDGKTLTRGNAETRRVEIVRELMIALNEGVRWHRARACGETSETSEKSSGPGKTSFPERKADADARAAADGERRAARSSAEGVSRRKAKARLPRRAAGGSVGSIHSGSRGEDGGLGEARDAAAAAATRRTKKKTRLEKPTSVLSGDTLSARAGLDRTSLPDDAEQDEDLRTAWIAFAFLWGAAVTYVVRVACRRSSVGASVVRRRVKGMR